MIPSIGVMRHGAVVPLKISGNVQEQSSWAPIGSFVVREENK